MTLKPDLSLLIQVRQNKELAKLDTHKEDRVFNRLRYGASVSQGSLKLICPEAERIFEDEH